MIDVLNMGLTLPPTAAHDGIARAGTNVETAGPMVMHFFTFKQGEKKIQVRIMADGTMSRAQIEDMAAGALETWLKDLEIARQKKVGKHTPDAAERRDVGAAIREFRLHAAKRRASSNARLYYPVG